MRTPNNQTTGEEGHMVTIRDKSEIIKSETYPTYGKAMWAIKSYEEKYGDKFIIEYRDTRIFNDRIVINP
jgi:hypothetical protein